MTETIHRVDYFYLTVPAAHIKERPGPVAVVALKAGLLLGCSR